MRYLRYAFLAVLAILLITVALANREPVTLRLMTDDLAAMAGFSGQITLPLFRGDFRRSRGRYPCRFRLGMVPRAQATRRKPPPTAVKKTGCNARSAA